MNAPLRRRPVLRWVAPGAALAMIIAGSQVAAHWPANASTNLPPRSAAQLLTNVQRAKPVALSGTVTAKMSLGLPELPSGVAAGDPTNPINLLSATHQAKVWYDGDRSARVAVIGDSAETDLITNTKGLWIWKSADKSVLHIDGPTAKSGGMPHGPAMQPGSATPNPAQLRTPENVAAWALKMLDPTTAVTTTSNDRVAGRAAYELVLTPKTSNTKIGSVRIAIDADHQIPLRAEVFARGATSPAINVGFSSISFSKPPASRFDFTPPPGSKVTNKSAPAAGSHAKQVPEPAKPTTAPKVVGTAWSSVLVGTTPTSSTANTKNSTLQSALKLLPKVSGSWGSGHLLNTALFSAVITDDGHFAVGAVQPATLYAALG
ncbi:LolA family protein [Flexivirga alba]|uniref:Outer membrane lipoprotein carrier protein LolA n=1 Tax=Flexivirga alba TaxID=702742 RepID=A0ABW2AFY4_9MICO